jgi:hypothetical protein
MYREILHPTMQGINECAEHSERSGVVQRKLSLEYICTLFHAMRNSYGCMCHRECLCPKGPTWSRFEEYVPCRLPVRALNVELDNIENYKRSPQFSREILRQLLSVWKDGYTTCIHVWTWNQSRLVCRPLSRNHEETVQSLAKDITWLQAEIYPRYVEAMGKLQ